MGDVLIEEISRGMGAARCICKTNAKPVIKQKGESCGSKIP